jgi:hypothetical protein
MTGLYNTLERIRELEQGADVEPLSESERDMKDAGQVQILKELHDEIDRAVLEAYGWLDLAPALVGKPGGTTPSPHKSADQEAAEEELLTRLVALNQERVAEEARGHIRWLRPDYQIPKLGKKAPQPTDTQSEAELVAVEDTAAPKWPKDPIEQSHAVREFLADAVGPLAIAEISASFKGGRNRAARVEKVLDNMTGLGIVREEPEASPGRYFVGR